MWLLKPVYEALPFYYVAIGFAALLAGVYVDYWHWPVICVVIGVGALLAGLVVLLRRRDYRAVEREHGP